MNEAHEAGEFDTDRLWRRFDQLLTAMHTALPNVKVRQCDSHALDVPATPGLAPLPALSDERFEVSRVDGQVIVSAATEAAAFRGLTRLLLTPDLAGGHGPRFAWRGLSIDLVRHPWPLETVLSLIDLACLHGLNVVHLHLTDHQGWRLPFPAGSATEDSFTEDQLRQLRQHAADRYIALVPEIDLPGHMAAALGAHPALRNPDAPPPHPLVAYLDPDVPAVLPFITAAVTELVHHFPDSPVHVGGDEAFGMPADKFDVAVQTAVMAARDAGAPLVVGWQEAVRTGAKCDVLQYWMAPADIPDEDAMAAAVPAEFAELARGVARGFQDVAGDPARLADSGVPVLVSTQNPLYLDRRTSDPSTDPEQTAHMQTIGFPGYAPLPTTALLNWDPATEVTAGTELAGVEAAIWCETIDNVDDLAILLLPRLGLFGELAWQREPLSLATVTGPVRRGVAYWRALGFQNYYRSQALFAGEA